jgi:hypothetical protein
MDWTPQKFVECEAGYNLSAKRREPTSYWHPTLWRRNEETGAVVGLVKKAVVPFLIECSTVGADGTVDLDALEAAAAQMAQTVKGDKARRAAMDPYLAVRSKCGDVLVYMLNYRPQMIKLEQDSPGTAAAAAAAAAAAGSSVPARGPTWLVTPRFTPERGRAVRMSTGATTVQAACKAAKEQAGAWVNWHVGVWQDHARAGSDGSSACAVHLHSSLVVVG